MVEFERRGGRLVIQDVGIEELEQLANDYELVLLAAGKGEVVKQFERDDVREVFLINRSALLGPTSKHEANFTLFTCDFLTLFL